MTEDTPSIAAQIARDIRLGIFPKKSEQTLQEEALAETDDDDAQGECQPPAVFSDSTSPEDGKAVAWISPYDLQELMEGDTDSVEVSGQQCIEDATGTEDIPLFLRPPALSRPSVEAAKEAAKIADDLLALRSSLNPIKHNTAWDGMTKLAAAILALFPPVVGNK